MKIIDTIGLVKNGIFNWDFTIVMLHPGKSDSSKVALTEA